MRWTNDGEGLVLASTRVRQASLRADVSAADLAKET
jgi:hypothetical protein